METNQSTVSSSTKKIFNYTVVPGVQFGNITKNSSVGELLEIYANSFEILEKDSSIVKIFPKQESEATLFFNKLEDNKIKKISVPKSATIWKDFNGISLLNDTINSPYLIYKMENNKISEVEFYFE